MDRGDIEEAGGEEEFPRLGGGKYRPVGAHDRAVVEMSSVDPGSSSSTLKYDLCSLWCCSTVVLNVH